MPADSRGASPEDSARDASPPPSDAVVERAPRPADTTFPEPAVMGMPSLGTITVNLAAPGAAVPINFVGLSVEWQGLGYLGTGGAANPATVELFKNFAEDGHRIDVRVGGNSSDRSWWTVGPGTRPALATQSTDATYISTFRSLYDQTGAKFIIGTNLSVNDTANPISFIQAVRAGLPPEAITAFEIGNEPDLYGNNGHRPAGYSVAQYLTEVQPYIDAFAPVAGTAPALVIPALAGSGWFTQVLPLMTRNRANMAFATLHAYPTTTCGRLPTDANYPTPAQLITDAATLGIGTRFAGQATQARTAGFPLRVAEFNSAACAGAAGASDVFAAALWSSDVLFRLAQAGVSGVDFHTSGFYAAYKYSAGVLSVMPLYYGMKFFSLATAHGGRLLPVQVTSTARVRAFATLGDDGITRVAILNEDAAADGAVTVSLSAARGQGVVSRLKAPGLTAMTGLSLEGRTFDGSPDGLPVGGKAVGLLAPATTNYSFSLPRLSGVVLAISR
jgi:hypothetical protein